MTIFDLYSKRQKELLGDNSDLFTYDSIPKKLKVQIIYIIRDAIGNENKYPETEAYGKIFNGLCREFGLFKLSENSKSIAQSIFDFFLEETNIYNLLDLIELTFQIIDIYVRKEYSLVRSIQHDIVPPEVYIPYVTNTLSPDEAINELNNRFLEHRVGFQFESSMIIRIDSLLVHSEIIKPILNILREDQFKGANEEFLVAHENYRNRNYKDCLLYSLKAFESVMKVICFKHNWQYQETDSASSLIQTCITNGIFPSYLESQISCLQSLIKDGLLPVRNKHAGHGQGVECKTVPDYLAQYALNLSASNILLLTKAEKERQVLKNEGE